MAWGHVVPIGPAPRMTSAVCAEPCVVLSVSRRLIEEIAQTRPEIWAAAAALMHSQVQRVLKMMLEILGETPKARLRARLLALTPNDFANGPINISQQVLAEMLGVTRRTLAGHLAELEKTGAIGVRYGRIEVRDRAILARID